MGSPFGRHAASAEEIATLGSEHDLRFFVDPLNPRNAYATVNTAYAAAIARLPAGTDVIIELAPNMIHAVAPALVVATDRNLVIKVAGEFLDSADLLTTSISGTITLPDASGEPARRNLFVTGLRMDLIVNQATSWNTIYKNLNFYGGLTLRTNGVNGCNTTLTGCRISSVSTMFRDADANAGLYVLIDTQVDVFATGAGPHTVFDMSAADETSFRFYSCNILLNNMMDVLSLINAGAPPSGMYIDFYDTTLDLDNFGGTSSIIENGNANIYTTWVNTTIFAPSGAIIIGVDDDDPVGWPKYVGGNVPVNPKPGMLWVNPATGREAIYRMGTTYDYWQWSDWAAGECLIDTAGGNILASTGSFDTLTNAYNALNDVTSANAPLIFKLVSGQTYATGTPITFGNNRSISIISISPNPSEYERLGQAILDGTIIMTGNEAGDRRKLLIGAGMIFQAGAITQGPNWTLLLKDMLWWSEDIITRTHGDTDDCKIIGQNVQGNSGSFRILDTNVPPGWDGTVEFNDSRLTVNCPAAPAAGWGFEGNVEVVLRNTQIELLSDAGGFTFIDWNSTDGSFNFIGTTILSSRPNMILFANAGTVNPRLTRAELTTGPTFAWPNIADFTIGLLGAYKTSGRFHVVAEATPLVVPTGTIWTQPTTGEVRIWDGTYWTFNKTRIATLNHSNVGATMIVPHTLITDTIYKIRAEIVGRLRDGPPSSEFRSVVLEATCTHLNGAAAAVVGAITSVHDVGNGASAGWTMTLAANGDDIEIQATTGVAESCDWFAKISWEKIASLA